MVFLGVWWCSKSLVMETLVHVLQVRQSLVGFSLRGIRQYGIYQDYPAEGLRREANQAFASMELLSARSQGLMSAAARGIPSYALPAERFVQLLLVRRQSLMRSTSSFVVAAPWRRCFSEIRQLPLGVPMRKVYGAAFGRSGELQTAACIDLRRSVQIQVARAVDLLFVVSHVSGWADARRRGKCLSPNVLSSMEFGVVCTSLRKVVIRTACL